MTFRLIRIWKMMTGFPLFILTNLQPICKSSILRAELRIKQHHTINIINKQYQTTKYILYL